MDRPALSKAGPQFAAMVATAAAVSLLLVFLLPLPPALVLPALSFVSFAAAVIVALFAYYGGVDRHAEGVTLWDVAGVLVLIWIGAGMLSAPEQVVQLFGPMTTAQ